MNNTSARAVRYDLLLPVYYRAANSLRYESSRTQNISRSGVLFSVPNPLYVGAWLEMRVEFIAEDSRALGLLFCTGPVVRVYPAENAIYAALRIDKCTLTAVGGTVFAPEWRAQLPS